MRDEIEQKSVVPDPTLDPAMLMRDMMEGTLIGRKLPKERYAEIDLALHDHGSKEMLALAGAWHFRALTHPRWMAILQTCLGFMDDPEYIRRLTADPDTLMKLCQLATDRDKEHIKFYMELLKSQQGGKGAGGTPFNPKEIFNFFFGENAAVAVIPESLKDPDKRRLSNDRITQAIAILRGEIPQAPIHSSRLKDGPPEVLPGDQVIDVPKK